MNLFASHTPPSHVRVNTGSTGYVIKEIKQMTKNKMLLLGDFNATHQSWFCHTNNSRGIKLENYLLNNKMLVVNGDTGTC